MKVGEIESAFRLRYKQLLDLGLFITGIYHEEQRDESNGSLSIGITHSLDLEVEVIPEHCHISVMHPFLFDNRQIPEYFMGVKVQNVIQASTIPTEIEEIVYDPAGFEDWFTPEQYERYVRENMIEIRSALKQPYLTYEVALDAICCGNFQKYMDEHEEKRLKRLFS